MDMRICQLEKENFFRLVVRGEHSPGPVERGRRVYPWPARPSLRRPALRGWRPFAARTWTASGGDAGGPPSASLRVHSFSRAFVSLAAFFSASVNERTRMLRTAPVVRHVAMPNGLQGPHSMRME